MVLIPQTNPMENEMTKKAKSKVNSSAPAAAITSAQLVVAHNVIADAPVKAFKNLADGVARCDKILADYSAEDLGGIPAETLATLKSAGVKIPEAKKGKKAKAKKEGVSRPRGVWGSHCHDRVFQAIVDNGNKPITKVNLSHKAETTVSVVSNAFHDFKRGIHTPDSKVVEVLKTREDGETLFSLNLGKTPVKAAKKVSAKVPSKAKKVMKKTTSSAESLLS
jgi:hypothetical protein